VLSVFLRYNIGASTILGVIALFIAFGFAKPQAATTVASLLILAVIPVGIIMIIVSMFRTSRLLVEGQIKSGWSNERKLASELKESNQGESR
jgi:hypothetical protein